MSYMYKDLAIAGMAGSGYQGIQELSDLEIDWVAGGNAVVIAVAIVAAAAAIYAATATDDCVTKTVTFEKNGETVTVTTTVCS